MKMLIICVLAFLFVLKTNTLCAQFKFGGELGYVNSHYIVKDIKANSLNGYKIGVIASHIFSNNICLESGISFQYKGVSFNPGNQTSFTPIYRDVFNMQYKEYSLEIPLQIGYRIQLSEHFSLLPKIGVFISYNIGGKGLLEWKDSNNQNLSSEFTLHSALINYGERIPLSEFRSNPGDMDGGGIAGIDFNYLNFSIRCNYKLGVVNRRYFDFETFSRVFSISLAYYFK